MPWRAARGVGERCPSDSEQDTRTGEEVGRMPGKDWGSAMGEPLPKVAANDEPREPDLGPFAPNGKNAFSSGWAWKQGDTRL